MKITYQSTRKSREDTQEHWVTQQKTNLLNLKVMKKFIHKHVILRYKILEK